MSDIDPNEAANYGNFTRAMLYGSPSGGPNCGAPNNSPAHTPQQQQRQGPAAGYNYNYNDHMQRMAIANNAQDSAYNAAMRANQAGNFYMGPNQPLMMEGYYTMDPRNGQFYYTGWGNPQAYPPMNAGPFDAPPAPQQPRQAQQQRQAQQPYQYQQPRQAQHPGEVPQPGQGPPPGLVEVSHAGRKYIVVKVLQATTNDPTRMSNGINVIQCTKTAELFIEKHIMTGVDTQFDRAATEIAALKQIRAAGGSPNVNIIYESFWGRGSTNCTMLLEYCDRGTLQDIITHNINTGDRVSEEFAWHVMAGLIGALTYIHYGIRNPASGEEFKLPGWNTICHLDIKPANVFLSSRQVPGLESKFSRVVLGDFGCAVTWKDINAGKQKLGFLPGATPGWTPPEISYNEQQGHTGIYGKTMDIWQIGGVLQVLCLHLNEPDQDLVLRGRPCGSKYSLYLNKVVATAMEPKRVARASACDLWQVYAEQKRAWEETKD